MSPVESDQSTRSAVNVQRKELLHMKCSDADAPSSTRIRDHGV